MVDIIIICLPSFLLINIARLRIIVKTRRMKYAIHGRVGLRMIVFDKLWITMKQKNVSQYRLIKEYGISAGQLDRLRKNENVSTFTLNTLCRILQCDISDIAEYKEN